jgi:hypothetical protein
MATRGGMVDEDKPIPIDYRTLDDDEQVGITHALADYNWAKETKEESEKVMVEARDRLSTFIQGEELVTHGVAVRHQTIKLVPMGKRNPSVDLDKLKEALLELGVAAPVLMDALKRAEKPGSPGHMEVGVYGRP